MSIKAVVFDFDGLILDTEIAEFRAWQQVYQEHGAVLLLKDWASCIGTSADAFDPIEHLEKLTQHPVDADAIKSRRQVLQSEFIRNEKVLPGVTDYLESAQEMGLGIALASSSTHEWVEGYLAQHGLLGFFQHIRGRDDVEKVKPDPALYRLALEALGVSGYQAVAFEDSAHGVAAAKQAGMFCVAVPNQLTKGLDLSRADMIIGSMADIPLKQLLIELERKAS